MDNRTKTELSSTIHKIKNLRERIEKQILTISGDMSEEEKLSVESWNPILKRWADELEKIEDELLVYSHNK